MDLYKICFLISFLLVISLNKWFCLNNTLTGEISNSPTSRYPHEGYKARIVNGSVVSLTDHPHTVYIFTRVGDSKMGMSCGGSIIGTKWILTAGHCLPSDMRFEDIRVYVGSEEKMDGKKYSVKRAIQHHHHKYSIVRKTKRENYLFDYMLLELKRDLKYGEKVQKIIAGRKEDIVAGSKAIFTGYGPITSPKQQVETIPNKFLRMAKFEITTNADCVKLLGDVKLKAYEFCAVGAKTSACVGDSGGPLVVNTDNGPRLIGVMSHGCKISRDSRFVNVFVSVPYVQLWIAKFTGI